MGKEKSGFLTPKAIANRIKSKGLQKLRWFCQMCQKQCRDENGFKCHLTSESHQRQLLLFADNPDKYIDSFSEEFLETFQELLRRRFGTKRVQANIVYQEYIAYKEHTHMNSTQWETLTDFVKWMGREGHCVVDHTEKGWFITYIDRAPETIAREIQHQKKERMDMDDQERTTKLIQQQIDRAATADKHREIAEATELVRENEEEKIVISLGTKKVEATSTNLLPGANALQLKRQATAEAGPSHAGKGVFIKPSGVPPGSKKRKSALDEIMQAEEQTKEKVNRKEYWLHVGIVVKVVTKRLGDKYYKKKAVIREVPDKFAAVIKMLDSGDKMKVDQTHVETVIPAIGKPVMVVNGGYRGNEAILETLDEKKFSCSVTISGGLLKGRLVDKLAYEDISKLHIPS